MKWLFGLSLVLLASAAQAQDIGMCTKEGYSAACCRQSLAKYGPFGQAHGNKKANRRADLNACRAKEKKS